MIKQFKSKVKYELTERLYCDRCGGEMRSTGIAYTSYPPSYEHKCSSCDYRVNKSEVYPNSYFVYGKEKEIKNNG
jgi:tRNA(Ile2) C34 agmatinyltransferase TiaS